MGLHFSKQEFSKRKNNVIKNMKEQKIDALLMFRQESMYWLTGYDTFGYVFFQTLILDKDGKIILLTRAPDLRQAQNTSNIEDIRIWIDKDGSNPTDDLKIILDELNLKGKKLGVEYEAYGLTGRNALRLNKSLENYCTIEDKSELITKLRVVKSKEEISYVRKAAALADKALDEVWKHAKAGVSESKILAEMNRVIFEGGGDYPANEFIIGSGKNGRVTKKDILAFVNGEIKPKTTSSTAPVLEKSNTVQIKEAPPVVPNGEDEIIEMDRMRKMIADHMVHSVHTAPHVTSFVEADVTNLVLWRNKHKVEFEKREGEKRKGEKDLR